jgi:hypothetical protein
MEMPAYIGTKYIVKLTKPIEQKASYIWMWQMFYYTQCSSVYPRLLNIPNIHSLILFPSAMF